MAQRRHRRGRLSWAANMGHKRRSRFSRVSGKRVSPVFRSEKQGQVREEQWGGGHTHPGSKRLVSPQTFLPVLFSAQTGEQRAGRDGWVREAWSLPDPPRSSLGFFATLLVIWQALGRLRPGLHCLHRLLQAAAREDHVAGSDFLCRGVPQVLFAVPDAVAKVDQQACKDNREEPYQTPSRPQEGAPRGGIPGSGQPSREQLQGAPRKLPEPPSISPCRGSFLPSP